MSAIGTFTEVLGGVGSGNPLGGMATGAGNAVAGIGLDAIGSWVLGGTKTALREVAGLIGAATTPNLESTWFSTTYWRVAALAAMLTVPFLCAAAVQAVARADLSLLARTAFGYLPVSVLGVSLAAPLTMLLLAATDQMSAGVSAGAVQGGAGFLDQAAVAAGAYSTVDGSPFVAVVLGVFLVVAALALAVELLVRAAAVYVVVLMLPLAFAALVWPARRVWAARLVELLVSLILSKFAIVAVLSLAGAAFAGGGAGISELLTAMALVLLATFSPWALMRILPFTELAAGAAGLMRHELPVARDRALGHAARSAGVGEMAMELPARLRRQASQGDPGAAAEADRAPSPTPPEFADSDDGGSGASTTAPAAAPESAPAPSSDSPQAGEPQVKTPYVPPDLSHDGEGVRLGPELSNHVRRSTEESE